MAVLKKVVVEDEEDLSTLKTSETEQHSEESATNSSESEVDSNESVSEEAKSENDESHNVQEGNAGWVDSIAKILKTNKPKRKRTLVLSKAKKLSDVKKQNTKYVEFEIEGKDGEIKKEKLNPEETCVKTVAQDKQIRKKKRELPNLRVKPNVLEKDREHKLTKIATKGVVQLFNAVKMQQKDLNNKLKEAGPLEVRKEKVLKNLDKRTFLDTLMGEKSQKLDDNTVVQERVKVNDQCDAEKKNTTWNVLRDDFMIGAKMKDWDKELENEMELE